MTTYRISWSMVLAVVGIGSLGTMRSSAQTLEIPIRPAAIDQVTLLQAPDGIFDTAQGESLIAIFLENTGESALTGVQADLSVPPGSNIIVVEGNSDYGTLSPGTPALGIFRADFSGANPGKYSLTLDVTADAAFSESVSRSAFVMTTWESGGVYYGEVPEGTLGSEISSFYGGTNILSMAAPTELTWTLTLGDPFDGQFGPLAFEDPWWKIVGGVVAIGSGAIVGATCSDDVDLPWWATALAGAATVGGAIAAGADEIDPFRRGEENTLPLPDELTTQEVVSMAIDYLDEPIAGTPYNMSVSWTFTRFTTGNTYEYSVSSELQTNQHFTSSRVVETDQPEYLPGDTVVVSAQFDGGALTNLDLHPTVGFEFDGDPSQVAFILLRDDGHGVDPDAGDGWYTGSLENIVSGDFELVVVASDTNQTAAGTPPLEAAQEIGGMIASAPMELVCPEPPKIPTVSEWGLIVMALLLLTGGTIVFGRRRRPAVA